MLGYTSVTGNVATSSKTVFVKVAAKFENTSIYGKNLDSTFSKGKKKGLYLSITFAIKLVTFIPIVLNIESCLGGIKCKNLFINQELLLKTK